MEQGVSTAPQAKEKFKYIHIIYMDLFTVPDKYCQRFKEKNNPTYKKIILKNKQKLIGKLTFQYLKINYFIAQLCFINDYINEFGSAREQ